MFTFNGRDAHRTLPALKVHLPFQRPIGEILPERQKTEDDEADPALQRLPAPGLRGTWARAYALLTRLVSQIGWDELLKTRSAVFVMEEEYRMQKAQTDIHQALRSANGVVTSQTKETDVGTSVIHEDGTVVKGDDEDEDDGASTRALAPPTPKLKADDINGRVSTESTDADDDVSEMTKVAETATDEIDDSTTNGDSKPPLNGLPEPNGVPRHVLEKPSQAAATEGEQNGNDGSGAEPFSFSNKRLCERWLDNLFMVLYEVNDVL